MMAIGDIHIFVSNFDAAMRFWATGLGLQVVQEERGGAAAFAELEFPEGGPAIRLFGGAQARDADEREEAGARPSIRFDVLTDEFDDILVRALEHGGQQIGEIESYRNLRVVAVADPDGNSFELLESPQFDDDDANDDSLRIG